jgi:hypothetical protein
LQKSCAQCFAQIAEKAITLHTGKPYWNTTGGNAPSRQR